MKLLAIDPGNELSAYAIIDAKTYKPIVFDKAGNEAVMGVVKNADYDKAVIEMVQSYGMGVGASVFETVFWIGRFFESAKDPHRMFRGDVKLNICGQKKAKDSNIRIALIDRFAQFDFKRGTGIKKMPDWFYGFRADIWQAYALGVSWLDREREN